MACRRPGGCEERRYRIHRYRRGSCTGIMATAAIRCGGGDYAPQAGKLLAVTRRFGAGD